MPVKQVFRRAKAPLSLCYSWCYGQSKYFHIFPVLSLLYGVREVIIYIMETPNQLELMTRIISCAIPVGSTDGTPEADKSVMAILTSKMMNWTWTIYEGEMQGDDMLFFGRVNGFASELGYFSWSELEQVPDLAIAEHVVEVPHGYGHTLEDTM